MGKTDAKIITIDDQILITEYDDWDQAFKYLLEFTQNIHYKSATLIDVETGNEVVSLRKL